MLIPRSKSGRACQVKQMDMLQSFLFYSSDDLGLGHDKVDRELRRKLIRDGEPKENLWEICFRDWLMQKAGANARNAVVSSVLALVVLVRLQRCFKERYYNINGPFQAVGSVRFESNIRTRDDDSQPSTTSNKQETVL